MSTFVTHGESLTPIAWGLGFGVGVFKISSGIWVQVSGLSSEGDPGTPYTDLI